jgi:hypothetical protein
MDPRASIIAPSGASADQHIQKRAGANDNLRLRLQRLHFGNATRERWPV